MTEDLTPPRMSWKGRLVSLLVGLVLAVGACEIALRIVYPGWSEFYSGSFMHNAYVEGYGQVRVGKPGFDGHFAQNNGDFRVHIKINAAGLRNDEPAEAADGRIWVVGDSMAFGWGVARDKIYTAVIGRELGRPTYNVASPGANVCGYQRLVARMPNGATPAAVVVGLILENDLADYDCKTESLERKAADDQIFGTRMGLSDFKQYLIRYSALYSFFTVSLKRVDLVREALIRIGIIKPAIVGDKPLYAAPSDRIVAGTIRELLVLRGMFKPTTPFLIALAPSRAEVLKGNADHKELRELMVEKLRAAGLDTVDLIGALASAPYAKTHFRHDGHWTADGHALAGAAIAKALRELK